MTTENVYNWIPSPEKEIKSQPRYKSQFAQSVRDEYKRGKASHYTMGEVKTLQPSPQHFLRKGTGVEIADNRPRRAQSAKTYREKCDETTKRQSVPKVTDHTLTPFRIRKNFVQKNVLKTMMSEPPAPIKDPCFVDSPNGNLQSLKGMIPIEKRQLGKVPGYLIKMGKEKEEERRKWEEEQRQILKRKEMTKLQDEDRSSILEGLRANWSQLNHVFQGLSLLTDTISKKLRKEKIEAQMDQLEKFIDLIERHPLIIISDF